MIMIYEMRGYLGNICKYTCRNLYDIVDAFIGLLLTSMNKTRISEGE